jgi:hypothetical protein
VPSERTIVIDMSRLSHRTARRFVWAFLAIAAGLSVGHGSEVRAATTVHVSHVAAEGAYIDAGKNAGLAPGDTVTVLRNQKPIGKLVVKYAASSSSATEVIESSQSIKAGDVVVLPGWVQARLGAEASALNVAAAQPQRNNRRVSPPRTQNIVRGDLSFQFYGRQDQTGSGGSWIQPGLRTRLEVKNVGGMGATFMVRHRSRFYRRSAPVSIGQSADEWSHRVFEFALVSDARRYGSQWGVGRVQVSDVRGMGYLDGGFYTRLWNSRFRTGVALGSSPDPRTSGFRFSRKKAGLFAAYEFGAFTSNRLVLSGALSTEYQGSIVSRDFLYAQAIFTRGAAFSFYQSAEFDINRQWRYDQTGQRFNMSNVYTMVTANIGPKFGMDVSYDSRRNYRYAEVQAIPDSLFDTDVHRGWRAGVRISPWSRLFFRANAGIRLHESDSVESRFVSFSARLTRFPTARQSVWLNMSIVEAGLTTGYRPMVSYRFPVSRGFFLQVAGAAQVYKSATTSISNYYVEASTSKSLSRRYFFSGSIRQYLDEYLRSTELYAELGVNL